MNIIGLLRKAVSHLPEDFWGLFKIRTRKVSLERQECEKAEVEKSGN